MWTRRPSTGTSTTAIGNLLHRRKVIGWAAEDTSTAQHIPGGWKGSQQQAIHHLLRYILESVFELRGQNGQFRFPSEEISCGANTRKQQASHEASSFRGSGSPVATGHKIPALGAKPRAPDRCASGSAFYVYRLDNMRHARGGGKADWRVSLLPRCSAPPDIGTCRWSLRWGSAR